MDDCIKVKVLPSSCQDLKLTERFIRLYCGTNRFVYIKDVDRTDLDKLETNGVVRCSFQYYGNKYSLKCEVLSTERVRTIADVIPDDGIIEITEKKRILSIKDDDLPSTKSPKTSRNLTRKIAAANELEVTISSANNTQNNIVTTQMTQNSLNASESVTSNVVKENTFNALFDDDIANEDLHELSVEEIMKLSDKTQFPKKKFIFGKIQKRYTAHLNFWTSIRIFTEKPEKSVEFTCKICGVVKKEMFPNFSNLNNHLKNHQIYLKWLENKEKANGSIMPLIDTFTLKIIKYIISSNASLTQLKNPHFIDLFAGKNTVPSYFQFRKTFLPSIMKKLYEAINLKLDRAISISLVIDLWSSPLNESFIAVAAVMVNQFLERELMVIGMKGMPDGSHSAEIVKMMVESIVNDYRFDKKKINAIVCDEGSNLVRLFNQLHITLDNNSGNSPIIDNQINNNDNTHPKSGSIINYANFISDENTDLLVSDEIHEDLQDVPDISKINENIDVLESEFKNLNYINKIPTSDTTVDKTSRNIRINACNDNNLYNLSANRKPIDILNINLGSDDIPRFSCACHKLNISVRHAIENHGDFLELISLMNQANATIRRTQELNKIFLDLNCRLKLENLTLWSSTLLMLMSVKRAYDKNAFDNVEYPVNLQQIEFYIQILLPAYHFSLALQRNDSSIAVVIPGILKLISIWQRYENSNIDEPYTDLCHLLIHFVRVKFNYELTSPVYQAAALLHISSLKHWKYRPFAISFVEKGLNSLKSVCYDFISKRMETENEENKQKETDTYKTPDSSKFFHSFFDDDDVFDNNESRIFKLNKCINEEIDTFSSILTNRDYIMKCSSTKKFWKENTINMTHFFELQNILLNICPSSGYIENFFSVTGFVCDRRRLNMNDDLIVARSLLKTNFHLIQEMNEIAE